jgi:hypothetical protein
MCTCRMALARGGLTSGFRGDVTSSKNNESSIFRRWKSNVKWRMFHRLNDKGDNSLTEIPGCPEKRMPSPWYYLAMRMLLLRSDWRHSLNYLTMQRTMSVYMSNISYRTLVHLLPVPFDNVHVIWRYTKFLLA